MNDGRKAALVVVTFVVVMAALLATPPLAAEEAALPEPEPSPATPAKHKTVERTPASAELVAWARGWKRHAERDLATLNHARACFSMPRIAVGWGEPPRWACRDIWAEAGDRWRARARDYDDRFDALRRRMSHPGPGGVERWRPLVRWHWPSHLVERALWVMKLESGGNPMVRNPRSGAAGLFQLYPAPDRWAEPDYNVWYAYYKKYRPAGSFSPWVVTH